MQGTSLALDETLSGLCVLWEAAEQMEVSSEHL